ncbi:MGH1-like glycoside hydrolase domain-containing protein [Pirellulimonas nuda]|nr:trehalase family glycosidase [Pirellulimonas nuda]
MLGRKHDPIPIEFPNRVLQEKGVSRQPPALHVSGPNEAASLWDNGFAAVNATLLLNLNAPDVLSSVRYAHPAPAFQGVYLWDSAFIAQVWRLWEPEAARDAILAVLELRDGARMQHVVADFVSSKYTQPPLLAWSLLRCCPLGDAEGLAVLSRAYPHLRDYNEWLNGNRRTQHGLYAWAHPYESGIDNSPRFSSRDESAFVDTRSMESPDFSAYMVLQNESLAEIARRVDDLQAAARFSEQAEEIRDAMNALLWSDEDGLYYDRDVASGKLLRHKTIAALLPLWAGVPDDERAGRLIEHAVDPRSFGTPIPLPSVARDSPDFVLDMWRGPVWINTAFAVIQGLERYGRLEEAGELSARLCEGVYRTFANERRVFEFYDPERFDICRLHRKQGNRWKQFTLGGKPVSEFVGWSGLVNTLVIENLIGLREGATGTLELRPLIPQRLAGMAFSIRLPAYGLAITVERTAAGGVCGVVRSATGIQRFDAPFGEAMAIGAAGNNARDIRCDSATSL